jgi:hypothetical protein
LNSVHAGIALLTACARIQYWSLINLIFIKKLFCIRRIMQAEETVLDRIEARKLRWFGHVMRKPEERCPAIIHSSWISPGRRKRG